MYMARNAPTTQDVRRGSSQNITEWTEEDDSLLVKMFAMNSSRPAEHRQPFEFVAQAFSSATGVPRTARVCLHRLSSLDKRLVRTLTAAGGSIATAMDIAENSPRQLLVSGCTICGGKPVEILVFGNRREIQSQTANEGFRQHEEHTILYEYWSEAEVQGLLKLYDSHRSSSTRGLKQLGIGCWTRISSDMKLFDGMTRTAAACRNKLRILQIAVRSKKNPKFPCEADLGASRNCYWLRDSSRWNTSHRDCSRSSRDRIAQNNAAGENVPKSAHAEDLPHKHIQRIPHMFSSPCRVRNEGRSPSGSWRYWRDCPLPEASDRRGRSASLHSDQLPTQSYREEDRIISSKRHNGNGSQSSTSSQTSLDGNLAPKRVPSKRRRHAATSSHSELTVEWDRAQNLSQHLSPCYEHPVGDCCQSDLCRMAVAIHSVHLDNTKRMMQICQNSIAEHVNAAFTNSENVAQSWSFNDMLNSSISRRKCSSNRAEMPSSVMHASNTKQKEIQQSVMCDDNGLDAIADVYPAQNVRWLPTEDDALLSAVDDHTQTDWEWVSRRISCVAGIVRTSDSVKSRHRRLRNCCNRNLTTSEPLNAESHYATRFAVNQDDARRSHLSLMCASSAWLPEEDAVLLQICSHFKHRPTLLKHLADDELDDLPTNVDGAKDPRRITWANVARILNSRSPRDVIRSGKACRERLTYLENRLQQSDQSAGLKKDISLSSRLSLAERILRMDDADLDDIVPQCKLGDIPDSYDEFLITPEEENLGDYYDSDEDARFCNPVGTPL